MINEISSLLQAISSASASFIAILGGCIATKIISLNQERASYKNKLSEINHKKDAITEQLNKDKSLIDERYSLCYIQENADAFESECELVNIYNEDEPNYIEYDDLLPYWEKARYYKAKFDDLIQKEECDINDLMIPVELMREIGDDCFALEFCSMYANWVFPELLGEKKYDTCDELCKRARKNVFTANTQMITLDIEQHHYKTELDALKRPKGLRLGFVIFALFTIFNVVLPFVLSIIPIPNEWCHVVAACSISLLTLGLASIFVYLAWMLKWKD